MQDYIALRAVHARQPAASGGSDATPKKLSPMQQASTAPSAMAMQLSSPSSSLSQRQAEGGRRGEEQHAEQALLNQLKEVPVKPVNAALLVEPLLDHGRRLLLYRVFQARQCYAACRATARFW